MKTLALLLLAAVLCTLNAQAQFPNEPLAYFPLQNGNDWYYEVNDYTANEVSYIGNRSQVLAANNDVIVTDYGDTPYGKLRLFQLQRDVSATYPEGMIFATNDAGKEGLLLFPSIDAGSFDADFGPACADGSRQMSVTEVHGGVSVRAGEFFNCVKITNDCPGGAGIYSEIILALGVGIIRHQIYTNTSVIYCQELVTAYVNGNTYGTLFPGQPTPPASCDPGPVIADGPFVVQPR